MTQGGKEVNRLFKADFFGERALLSNEPRGATVAAVQETVCLTLDRDTFVEILGVSCGGWGRRHPQGQALSPHVLATQLFSCGGPCNFTHVPMLTHPPLLSNPPRQPCPTAPPSLWTAS